jgi:uncharacterized repeat protein (TIGR01451 family)
MTFSVATKTRRSIGLVPLAVFALAALWSVSRPPRAEAAALVSAGNTVVRNTITVNYADAKGVAQTAQTSTVDVTVTTVASTPILTMPAAGSTDGTGATLAYTVRVRSTSNGPGAVTFTTSDGTFANIGTPGTVPTVPANIYLGATVIDPSEAKKGSPQTVANLASITFAVPNDNAAVNNTGLPGAFNDGIINGLISGDIVYITDNASLLYGPFNVTAVSDPSSVGGATAATGSITLTNNTGASISFTPQLNWQIVEAKDVTFTVTQGTITTVTSPASWISTINATMASAAAAVGPVTTNAHLGKISIVKYVRNVTTPGGTGATYVPPVTINGASNTFYTQGVTGKPGEILEYLAVINNAGSGDAKLVYATDILPTYTSLITATAYGGGTAGKIFARARFNALETDLNNDNTGGLANVAFGSAPSAGVPVTMTFWLGTGCTTSAGGLLTTSVPSATATSTAYLIYQVKIN